MQDNITHELNANICYTATVLITEQSHQQTGYSQLVGVKIQLAAPVLHACTMAQDIFADNILDTDYLKSMGAKWELGSRV